ncbi:MAG: SDR family oxidoreductase [Pseudomonadota bacterium]
MSRFEGKNVLITGGTSGMGLAGAQMIVEEGGRVAVTGTNPDRLAKAKAALPDGTLVLANDAADPEAAGALAAAVKEAMGTLHGVWLNAGFGKFGPNVGITADMFDAMTHVNVRGPVLQMAQLIPMIADGGSVLVTSSIAPYLGQPMGAIYASTKGAITALARSWAMDLAGRGIRSNILAPGPIETGFFEGMGLTQEQVDAFSKDIAKQVPLGRFGTSEEAAQIALFLLSDQSSYVTGSEYMVDGGMTLR